ncbi:hypothetical protein B0J14DRAFT_99670 [Halenospora varia]|nr:hypothetical protein B0J14DRAFT_99670 [Halenospora varia]
MATSIESSTPYGISEHLKNFHIKEHPKPQTFHPFTNLPTEIRLKIFNLVARIPRIIHFNHAGATRAKLALDPRIPPLLHVCQESRTETIHLYAIVYLNGRKLYINTKIDILLWISYPGPRTFKNDLEILVERGNFPTFCNLAISQKFWNRIVSDPGPVPLHGTGNQNTLYHMIRQDAAEGKLGKVTILDTDLKWDGVKGNMSGILEERS